MGFFIALLAALVPLSEIVKLVNIGTLFAFLLVNIGVIILRRTQPDMERPFRVPFVPVFPIIGSRMIIYLMTKLPWDTWVRFVVWLVIGLGIYYFYGRHHSRLQIANRERGQAAVSVVIGHDGSDSGDDAAVLGAQLAHATGDALVVVAVYPEENPIGAGRVDAEWVAYMREQAEEVSGHARGFLEGRGVQAEYRVVGSRSAAHGLDDVAEAEGASVIVVGSSRRARGGGSPPARRAIGCCTGRSAPSRSRRAGCASTLRTRR